MSQGLQLVAGEGVPGRLPTARPASRTHCWTPASLRGTARAAPFLGAWVFESPGQVVFTEQPPACKHCQPFLETGP